MTGFDDRPRLYVVDETGSTNDDAKRLALDGAPSGTAVAARLQTAGRGSRGRSWSSAPGNLFLSVVLRPRVPMSSFVGLPAVCAYGVLDVLRREAGMPRTMLKWPNDLVLNGGKLGGVLVEAGAGASGAYAVCGVGLNLVPRPQGASVPFDRPGSLPYACAADSLGDACPGFEWFAEKVGAGVVSAVRFWEGALAGLPPAAGPLLPVLDGYLAALSYRGEAVDVLAPDGTPMGGGTFARVDEWGRAVVRLADGVERAFACEQASIRPAANTAGPGSSAAGRAAASGVPAARQS